MPAESTQSRGRKRKAVTEDKEQCEEAPRKCGTFVMFKRQEDYLCKRMSTLTDTLESLSGHTTEDITLDIVSESGKNARPVARLFKTGMDGKRKHLKAFDHDAQVLLQVSGLCWQLPLMTSGLPNFTFVRRGMARCTTDTRASPDIWLPATIWRYPLPSQRDLAPA